MARSEAKPTIQRALQSEGFGLPHHLLLKARDRLRVILWLTLFAAVLSFTVRLSRAAGEPGGFEREGFGLSYVTLGGLAAASFLWLTRGSGGDPARALRLGLVYEVLLGYIVAIGSTAQEATRHGHAPYMTWATGLVLVFPLVVPCPPRMTLVAAIATGTSAWAAVALSSWMGLLEAQASTYVEVAVSPTIGTVIAYFCSKIVYGLSRDYAAATRAGSYTLKKKLGAGGMGEVWLAEHMLLARPAAVKLIRRDSLGTDSAKAEAAAARFRREAEATALLCSPHTVDLYDYGITDDGSFYYVMELLEGLDLDSLVSRHGPMPPERVAHLLMQAAASLAEAHEHGLVHRDIKPANIYVCQYGLIADFVKVLDFGLVKAHYDAPAAGENLELTVANTVLGTPAFMAPEQITKSAPVGPASDVYSLGCVAYWLLTGRLPFEGETAVVVMAQHLSYPVPSPSEAAPGPVPPELEAIIVDCLAKDPAARPNTMQTLYDRLALVPFDHPWDQARATAWWKIHAPAVTARSIHPLSPK